MRELTIVMYHYVRPISDSEYPGIRGLELDGFRTQLDYLEENYSIVSSEEVIGAVTRKLKLPPNACWLTFDDGYKDHYQYVMPELIQRGITGAFFPPKQAISDARLLDANSIHHILSCCESVAQLVADLNELCLMHGVSNKEIEEYFREHGVASRFDNANTIYVKRMLQHALPEAIRSEITSTLLNAYVSVSELELAKKLYMNTSEVSELVNCGMYVGSHGSMHYWLNQKNEDEQRLDISESIQFLEEVGAPTSDWIMCYPYGAYNNSTLSIVRELGASLGVTTEVRKAAIGEDNPLILPRLDTNDLPQ